MVPIVVRVIQKDSATKSHISCFDVYALRRIRAIKLAYSQQGRRSRRLGLVVQSIFGQSLAAGSSESVVYPAVPGALRSFLRRLYESGISPVCAPPTGSAAPGLRPPATVHPVSHAHHQQSTGLGTVRPAPYTTAHLHMPASPRPPRAARRSALPPARPRSHPIEYKWCRTKRRVFV